MKVPSPFLIFYKPSNFISHMVQMKDFLSLDVKSSKRLYIPHGSDESQEL